MSIGWNSYTLGDVLELQYGRSLPENARRAGQVPVFGSNGKVGAHNEALVAGPGIILGRKGSVGAVTFSSDAFWPIDTTYYVVRKRDDDWWFLYLLLLHSDLSSLNSHSAVPGLNRESVYSIHVIVPDLHIQQVVSAIVRLARRAILLQEQLIGTVHELKQAAMQQLFTRGLCGERQKATAFGPIPESWAIAPLGECAHIQTGITKGKFVPPNEAIVVPYMRVANVQSGHLDLRVVKTITIRRDELPQYRLQYGDVLLTEGGDFDKLGRGFIWRDEIKDCVHQNHIFAVRANRSLLDPEYLAYLVQSTYGRSYFLAVAHKTTNLASINSTKLKALPVPLPTLEEQRSIAAALSVIDQKLDHHDSKLATLHDLFKTLLNELMTGRLRTDGIDVDLIETESVLTAAAPV